MANEIKMLGYPSGQTLYACVRNDAGEVWYPTDEVFEDVGTSGRTNANYYISMTDMEGGLYLADFPDGVSAGSYYSLVYDQVGSSPADSDHVIGGDKIRWTGVAQAAESIDESTATDLCNWALLKLGTAQEQQTIDAIDDGSPTANKCLFLYPLVRNEVLQRWPFNECREFADLGEELSGIEQADWEYAFTLPSDCLAVVAQIDQDGRTIKYEHEVRMGMLFTDNYSNTDEDSAYIEYILLESDTAKYSPKLKEAIATKLAAELAPVLNPKRTEDLKREYEFLVLPIAEGLNQAEQYSDDKGSYRILGARNV